MSQQDLNFFENQKLAQSLEFYCDQISSYLDGGLSLKDELIFEHQLKKSTELEQIFQQARLEYDSFEELIPEYVLEKKVNYQTSQRALKIISRKVEILMEENSFSGKIKNFFKR